MEKILKMKMRCWGNKNILRLEVKSVKSVNGSYETSVTIIDFILWL